MLMEGYRPTAIVFFVFLFSSEFRNQEKLHIVIGKLSVQMSGHGHLMETPFLWTNRSSQALGLSAFA